MPVLKLICFKYAMLILVSQSSIVWKDMPPRALFYDTCINISLLTRLSGACSSIRYLCIRNLNLSEKLLKQRYIFNRFVKAFINHSKTFITENIHFLVSMGIILRGSYDRQFHIDHLWGRDKQT